MPLVNECISILIRSMAQDNTWVGVVASSTLSSAFHTACAGWFFIMLSTPIHVRAIDTNPPKCYQYQSTLEYSQRGSFELVLLVASALSRWFFSVVIASNSILGVVALNFDLSPSCCLCIIKVVFQRGYCFKLYSQRGSFEFSALWALLY